MSAIKVIECSLFDFTAKYLAHQTNCVSHRSAGLAAEVFNRYPYADVYSRRINSAAKDEAGTIIVSGNGADQRLIINMMGQYFPGMSKYKDSEMDGSKARKRYFFQCLTRIAEIPDLKSIAFPYGIGCGLAGGSWTDYLVLLEKFAVFLGDRAAVTICKLQPTQRAGDL